ncbi:hypothetical protein [Paenibacillus sp. NPDC055715]
MTNTRDFGTACSNVVSATPANVVLSNFGLDPFGNVVQGHRMLQSEMTTIPSLSPVV